MVARVGLEPTNLDQGADLQSTAVAAVPSSHIGRGSG